MGDILTPPKRSQLMARIRSKNTKPELLIRKGLHRMGFRYVLHDRRLVGKPDLVLPKWNAVIFIHGCFWHGHDCDLYRLPKTATDFWEAKVAANRIRDQHCVDALRGTGWRVLTIWECALKGKRNLGLDSILVRAAEWVRSDRSADEIRGGK